jgi:hypothetical protein
MTTNDIFPRDGTRFPWTTFSWLAVAGKRRSLEMCRIPAIQPEDVTGGLCGRAGLLGPTAELRRILEGDVWASTRSEPVGEVEERSCNVYNSQTIAEE